MQKITVMFGLNAPTFAALEQIAGAEGVAIADILRDAVKRDLYRRSRAKKAVRADERLVAPLRALLADDFAYSGDWAELQSRLQAKGYTLRESGAGLALFDMKSGAKQAKASDLGTSYARLMRRFRAPFPGHSHAYLFDQAMRGAPGA